MSRAKGQKDRRKRKPRPWPTKEEIEALDVSPGRKRLLSLRLTNAAAGAILGITRQVVSGVVSGRIFPSLEVKQAFRDRLGIRVIECQNWRAAREMPALLSGEEIESCQ